MTMRRREFALRLQKLAWATAAATWMKPITSLAQTERKWNNDPFAWGVASGRPRPDSVVLWTRLKVEENDLQSRTTTEEPIAVAWAIYSDENLRQLIQQGTVLTDSVRGHSVHVHVQGLQSAKPYWYQFTSGNAASARGKTRTAPALDAVVKKLKIALASCQHYEQGEYIAHQDIAQHDVDMVLFLGDYIYESSNPRHIIRKHGSGEPQTLQEYRARYALYKSDPMLQASHAAHPWVLMWDDHEVVNDYANDRDQRYTDPKIFLQRRAAAYQAYFENQPILFGPNLNSPSRASMRLNEQMAWGQLVDIWTLDCRQYRSYHACADPLRGGGRVVAGCNELDEPNRSMLGMEQEKWLSQGLVDSKRQWKIVAQATQLSSTAIQTPLGQATYTDAWDGYPQSRKRIMQNITQAKLQDVVTLGGDVHMNVAANLRVQPNQEKSPVVASEFISTSITSRGLDESVLSTIRANNADLLHARSDERGFALIEVSPSGVQCEFRTTPFPANAKASLSVQATYVVKSGVAGPQKA